MGVPYISHTLVIFNTSSKKLAHKSPTGRDKKAQISPKIEESGTQVRNSVSHHTSREAVRKGTITVLSSTMAAPIKRGRIHRRK